MAEVACSTELAGATQGAAWFQAARAELDAAEAGFLRVDFTDVRLATVSWLREAVLALQKYAAAMRPDVILVVTNLGENVREELAVALEATGSVIVAACVSTDLELRNPVVIGPLDPALDETIRAVEGQREFDASYVSRTLPHVGLSAANNRLSALQGKGILKSERRGRARIYQTVVEDLRWERT